MPSKPLAKEYRAAALFIFIVPMALTSAIGVLVAFGVRWAGKALSSATLSHALVFIFIILSFAFMGFVIGLRSIVAVRQGASDVADGDGGDGSK